MQIEPFITGFIVNSVIPFGSSAIISIKANASWGYEIYMIDMLVCAQIIKGFFIINILFLIVQKKL